jgi:hypothetical protein
MVVVEQGGGLRVDDEADVAAATAVRAVRAAERLELLAPDRGAPVAAVAAGGVQDDAKARAERVCGWWDAKGAARLRAEPPRRQCVCVPSPASGLGDDDVDDLAAPTVAEEDGPGSESEQGVVLATAHVDAGVEVRTALADDDLAGLDDLATEPLDAEPLSVGVAPVPRGTSALLVCHREPAFVCFVS